MECEHIITHVGWYSYQRIHTAEKTWNLPCINFIDLAFKKPTEIPPVISSNFLISREFFLVRNPNHGASNLKV
jgi:hypothetical protein